MSLDRQAKTLIAIMLLVTAVLVTMNLLLNPEPLADWSILVAVGTFAGAAVFIAWIWLEDRATVTETEAEVGGGLQLPQAREWVFDKTLPAATSTTDVGRGTPGAEAPSVERAYAGSRNDDNIAVVHTTDDPMDVPAVEVPEAAMEGKHESPEATEPAPSNPAANISAEAMPGELEGHPTGTGKDLDTPAAPDLPDTEFRADVQEEAAAAPDTSEIVQAAQAGDAGASFEIGEATAAQAAPSDDEALEAALDEVETEPAEEVLPTSEAAVQSNTYVDPLEQIEGIGPKFKDMLITAGITTFVQLSQTSEADLIALLRSNNIRAIPKSVGTWSQQAEYLAKGDNEGFTVYLDTLTDGRDRTDVDAEKSPDE